MLQATSQSRQAVAQDRYTTVAILFHWTVAVLVGCNLYLGWRMGFLKGLAQFDAFQLHKSVGLTVLVLSLARLGWRLVNRPPPATAGLPPWESRLATIAHVLFYIPMIGLPLTGWIVVSTSPLNIPTVLYHLVPWPWFPGVHGLAAASKGQVNELSSSTHVALAFGMAALLALHLAAVLKHQFLDRNPVLHRMSPLPAAPHLSD